jgi:hypothetical protein
MRKFPGMLSLAANVLARAIAALVAGDRTVYLRPVCFRPRGLLGQVVRSAGGLIVSKPAIVAVDDDPACSRPATSGSTP